MCTFEGRGGGRPLGHTPEVTKGVALALLGALEGAPPRPRLFPAFTLLSPEDVALEVEVAAVEKVVEDWRGGVLSTLACWQNKKARTHGSKGSMRGWRPWPGIWACSVEILT